MPVITIDRQAAIIPGKGLGGVPLGAPVTELREHLTGFLTHPHGRDGEPLFFLASPYIAIYRFEDHSVKVSVDVRTGEIFMVSAVKGYGGTLNGVLRPGMSVREALKVEPDLYFWEAQSALFFRGLDGVLLELSDPDPDPEDVPQLGVEDIVVYVPGELNKHHRM